MRFKPRDLLLSIALPGSGLILWQIAVSSGWLPDSLIASPGDSIRRFFELAVTRWQGSSIFPESILLHHAIQSLLRLTVGFGLGSLIGIVLGILCGTYRGVERVFVPSIRLLAPVPPIAWIPLLIIALGIGEASKISLIAIGAFFVVFFHTFRGVRAVDTGLIELATMCRKSRYGLITQILIPASAADIFSGLRIAMGLSWILLVAAEIIASADGLGWLIQDSRNFSRPADLIASIMAVGLLGAASDWTINRVERIVIFWPQSFRGIQ